MSPDKRQTVNGHKVEQYYWAGKNVVYIDNRLFDGSFDEAIRSLSTRSVDDESD
jgi:hypothetical protein